MAHKFGYYSDFLEVIAYKHDTLEQYSPFGDNRPLKEYLEFMHDFETDCAMLYEGMYKEFITDTYEYFYGIFELSKQDRTIYNNLIKKIVNKLTMLERECA